MNLKKLSETDLRYLINTETDLKKLEAYEQEWVDRFCPTDLDPEEDLDTIVDKIYQTWRDN